MLPGDPVLVQELHEKGETTVMRTEQLDLAPFLQELKEEVQTS